MINLNHQGSAIELYTGSSDEKDASYLLSYLDNVLTPASEEFFTILNNNTLKLHHVFSFNAILAHVVDYMIFIAKKKTEITRTDFIKSFDKRYEVDGSKHISNKFSLLDAINNSFKHVELDKKRYKELIEKYGDLSFHSLKADNGKVFFEMPLYKFDYARVVLRPISNIFNCQLRNISDIDDFINGRIYGSSGYGHFDYDYEPWDAIDRMIDYCNAECMDCGESDSNCDCQNFIYESKNGQFNPDTDPKFNFDDVMSNISGTREWRK
ncbi:TPA: hypothetical protein ACGTJE_002747 [Escherichia coli]|uniref:hypothetical protein n=1 Tax=Enterobacteriaceae TaxID=543 RepID=UPI0004D8BB47|nr:MULTISPECIES: hypothetical protein [Enterobacteriaceae]HCI8638808.1 hypothetical protein [Enterobacter hormaechei subsp. xiangfangensis]HDC4843945.1 hypothetical protein [Enterobacter kobei]EHF4992248.1 hypothetical protein [Enterobacter hormaechei]EHP7043144.1 hypothetical protein [Escherichia coli]EKD4461589.1 hypothetical protein [Escherichia coli]